MNSSIVVQSIVQAGYDSISPAPPPLWLVSWLKSDSDER